MPMGGNLVFTVQRAEKLPAEWISMLLAGNCKRVHGQSTAHCDQCDKQQNCLKTKKLFDVSFVLPCYTEMSGTKNSPNEIFNSDIN